MSLAGCTSGTVALLYRWMVAAGGSLIKLLPPRADYNRRE